MNLSFVGITFCFFFNSFFLYAFCGAEMMFDLFFDLAFQSNPVLMFFVPLSTADAGTDTVTGV